MNFKVEKYADVGLSEPFIARIMGLNEIVKFLNTSNEKKKSVDDLIFDIFEELTSAHNALREIVESEASEKEKTVSKLKKAYKDLYDSCWRSYADRMPKVTRCLGVEMNFLFGSDEKFEEGAVLLKSKHPALKDEFFDMLKDERTWHGDLQKIRNKYIQHKSLDDKDIMKFFTPNHAKVFFDNTWQAIEDIIVQSFLLFLNPMVQLVPIPEQERKASSPQRFKVIPNQEIMNKLMQKLESEK